MLVTEIVESTNVKLKKLHINVKHEWLQDCVEYLYENNYERDSICGVTKEQWLLNDLKEVSLGCLPPNLKSQSPIVLKGNYVLQVNSEIDIATSAYQQYSKLRNVNNENIEATIQTEDKISSHRMLKFYLTDGVQDVTAIEYRCINKIKNALSPGYKILVKGPVVCRNGVIFLTDNCMELMWGEVKENSIQNSKLAIVAAKLGLSAHPPVNNQNNSAENQNRTVRNQNNSAENQNRTVRNQNNLAENQNRTVRNQNNSVENLIPIVRYQGNTADNGSMNQIDTPHNQNNIYEEMMDFDEYQEMRPNTPTDPHSNNALEDDTQTFNVVKVSSSPFVYIKHIIELNECDRINKVFKVKAQILHLLKRPSFSKDKWMVECKITDGTGCLNVEVSSDLFSSIISHTPQEMVDLSLKRQSDPETKERIDKHFMKYLSEAKRKLESVYCIMELNMSLTPVIMQFIPFTEQHVMLLQKRLQGF